MQISHASNASQPEAQTDGDFVTVDSVKAALDELQELDVNKEYGVDDLLSMLEEVQASIQAATTEEEMTAAFAQLHDIKDAADSIKQQLDTPSEEEPAEEPAEEQAEEPVEEEPAEEPSEEVDEEADEEATEDEEPKEE